MPVEVLILVFGILFIIGGTILAGQWLSLRKPREGADDIERLAAGLEALRSDVERIGGTVHRLHERVDFAERLMLPPKQDKPPPDGAR